MITLPAYFTGYRRRKDRSAALSFATQEITTDDLAVIDELVMAESFGWLVFSPNEHQIPDLPKSHAEMTGKTPSERLRGVLFIEYKQKGSGDFETYYRRRMEAIIERLKSQLD